MNTERKNELISCLGLLFITIIWGVAFVVVKNALDALPVMYLLAFRFTVGTVAFSLIFFKRLIKANRSTVLHGSIIGIWLFLAYSFQTYGINHTTAGKNAFLTTVYMILVPFVYFLISGIKPRLKSLVAAIIGFVGIGFISLNESFSIVLGDYLTLICGLFFALQIAFIAKYTKDDDPVALAIVQMAVTSVLAFICAPIMGESIGESVISKEVIEAVLYLGLLSTGLCMLIQNVCQKYAPPGPATIIMSMESVFGALSGFLFLHEVMTGRMIFGCFLMLLAIFIVEFDVAAAFYPDEYLDGAYAIDYDKLYQEGVRGIIYDIDNTLVEHGMPADERSIKLLGSLRDKGFKIVFLSNNKEPRVQSFRDKALPEAEYIYKADKPMKKSYLKAVEMMGTDINSTVFIGDQLFTDVWGAKRCGIKNILVKPIDKKEEIQIVLKRRLEWIVLRSYKAVGKMDKTPHKLTKNS